MSTPVTNAETARFGTQTTTTGVRVRAQAAAIVASYDKADTADKALINAIVDELLVLTP